ncbi:MAG TPA: hypothetical protein VFW35_07250 [Sphingomicrobium sp.]|nr:hypothetical protein [Sphingomicrobium sp.]
MEQRRPYRPTAKHAGGPPLAQYRLYFMDSVERRITYSHEFEAENDERAVRIAEGWREGRRAELWTGARKVKSWEPDK